MTQAADILYGHIRLDIPFIEQEKLNETRLGRLQYTALAVLKQLEDADSIRKIQRLKSQVGSYSIYRPVVNRLIERQMLTEENWQVTELGLAAARIHQYTHPEDIIGAAI